MKKLFSKLIVGGATLGAVGATTMTTVSCGSSSDNTNKYTAVLSQAVAKVLQDARKTSSTAGIGTKATIDISISNITDAAAAIIKANKLDISTKYFSHLYIFASFKNDAEMPAGSLTVSQNSSSRPTSIKIKYDNTSFTTSKKSDDGSPIVTVLGKISIDIKERHLLVFKKLLSTIDYTLNNTAYYNSENASYTNKAVTNTFKSMDGQKIITGEDGFLAISAVPDASGASTTAAIGVTKNGIWYTSNYNAADGVTWYLADYGTNAKSYVGFAKEATVGTDNTLSSKKADFASIDWKGTTALIYAGMRKGTHSDDTHLKAGASAIGSSFFVRTAKVGKAGNIDVISNGTGSGKHPVIKVGNFGQSDWPSVHKPVADKLGEIIWDVAPGGNDGSAVNFTTPSDLSAVAVGGKAAATGGATTNVTGLTFQDSVISPDGKTGYIIYKGGHIWKFDITANTFSGGRAWKITKDGNKDSEAFTTAVASNSGLYAFSSGTASGAAGKVIAGIKYIANTVKAGNDVGAKVTSATITGETASNPWSYSDKDMYNGGTNARSLISTGLSNQTYIIDNDAKGDQGVVVAQEDASFGGAGVMPGAAVETATTMKHQDSGMVMSATNNKVYYLAPGSSTIKLTAATANTHAGVVAAAELKYGQIGINNGVFSEADLSKAVKSYEADSLIFAMGKPVASSSLKDGNDYYFTFGGASNMINVTLVGANIKYTGSALTWEGQEVK